MQEFIVPSVILDQARMLYRDANKLTVIVEGSSDRTFFRTIMGEQDMQFYPVNGWEKVRDIIDVAIAQGYVETMGIIDRDYHVLLNDGVTENDQLAFTDQNDLEMMLFLSPSFSKFLKISAIEAKLSTIENPRSPILKAASYLGALRALSLKNNYCLCFDEYKCKDYVEHMRLAADIKQLVKKVVQRTRSKGIRVSVDETALLSAVNDYVRDNCAECLCNGHDVIEIVGIAMRKLYASADATEYSEERVFEMLLQGYTYEEFQKSELFKKLKVWMENIGFRQP